MLRLVHQIEIATEPKRVLAAILDVEAWPRIFPPCRAARVVRREGDTQLVEITATTQGAAGVEMTWQSERTIDAERHAITFRQVKPSALLQRMTGAWRFLPTAAGTLVVLEHEFEVKAEHDGSVAGIRTAPEAEAYMRASCDRNSEAELTALKAYLEAEGGADEVLEFQDALEIPAPRETVYPRFYDVDRWPEVLPHCKAVKVLYDDGANQEFYMTVDTKRGPELIRSIRRGDGAESISYFQPEPPAPLRQHCGEWRLEATPAGTRVTSWHRVAFDAAAVRARGLTLDGIRKLARESIGANSRATLAAVAAAVRS